MQRFSRSLAALALATTLMTAGAAWAQGVQPLNSSAMEAPNGLYDKSPHDRPQMLTVWAILPWDYGFGVGAGARYTLPLLKDGLIDGINDSIELEFGADLSLYPFLNFGGSALNIAIPVGVRWTFHFWPNLNLYAKIGLGINIFLSDLTAYGYSPVNFFGDPGLGMEYRLNSKLQLRVELSYGGLKVGLGFEF